MTEEHKHSNLASIAESSDNHQPPANSEMSETIDVVDSADRVSTNTLQSIAAQLARNQIDEMDDEKRVSVDSSFSSTDTLVSTDEEEVVEPVRGRRSTLIIRPRPSITNEMTGFVLAYSDNLLRSRPGLLVQADNQGDAERVPGGPVSSTTPAAGDATSTAVVPAQNITLPINTVLVVVAGQNYIVPTNTIPIATAANLDGLAPEMVLAILRYLVRETEIDVDRSMFGTKAMNKMNRLRLVNRKMKGIVESWLATDSTNYLRSPEYDFFDPRTTTFVLNALFHDTRTSSGATRFDFRYGDIIHLGFDQLHVTSIQHLRLKVTDAAHMSMMLRFCPKFENLQTLDIFVLHPGFGSIVNQPDMFGYWVWELVWDKTKWCHPGKCCTCCQLPDIRLIERFAGGSFVQIPEPLKSSYSDGEVRYRRDMWYSQW